MTGVLFIGIGAFAVYYAASSYALGSIARMGPGMFPVILGVVLMAVGTVLCIGAFHRQGSLPQIRYRPFTAVMVGVLMFALFIEPFGMVPAITALTLAAVLGDTRVGLLGTVVLCVALSALAVLIFRVGLNIYIPLYNWPF